MLSNILNIKIFSNEDYEVQNYLYNISQKEQKKHQIYSKNTNKIRFISEIYFLFWFLFIILPAICWSLVSSSVLLESLISEILDIIFNSHEIVNEAMDDIPETVENSNKILNTINFFIW